MALSVIGIERRIAEEAMKAAKENGVTDALLDKVGQQLVKQFHPNGQERTHV